MTAEQIYRDLIAKMKLYHPSSDFSLVAKAYLLAKDAHANQIRKSGEPYIIHPLSVAVLLAELELDIESIVAGILHDVIEDTKYSYDDIAKMFSQEVADLVDGVTKLDKFAYSSKEEVQAENYRKMFLAMAKDIRVILIKMADRLHNMRTLKYMKDYKQREIAQETLDIYAPLAHRLGISKIRCEMEDLSLRYLDPDAYYDLAEKIKLKQSERVAFVRKIVEELKEKLTKDGLDAIVEGRPKHFFSIYKKMISQNKTLDQIYDLFALRVLVGTVKDCYEVLGMVHEIYTPIPSRFKDYIAMPKANMYQSLHNSLIGPEGEPFEVQIRTHEMHRISEYGIAAHWKYKGSGSVEETTNNEEAKLSWLRQILEWQRDLSDNKEYLNALKLDLNVFKQHVYCFSPKGTVVSLLSGSTPIDFAYEIHSAIGNKTVGAKVNGKIVPFEYVLSNGDRVEILTSQNSRGPSRDWLKFVKTSQAKNKINNWFKRQNKVENIARGKELLDKEATKKGYAISSLLANHRVDIILNKYSFQDWDSICAAVGHGGIKEGQIINKLIEDFEKTEHKNKVSESIKEDLIPEERQQKRYYKNSGIVVKGIGDISVRFSKCCAPVPGDEIIGFVTRGRGVSVHRTDCVNIVNLDEIERQRVIETEWSISEEAPSYRAEVRIFATDRMGIVGDITKILEAESVAIRNINARSVKGMAVIDIVIAISGRKQLDKVSSKILSLPEVNDIERVAT